MDLANAPMMPKGVTDMVIWSVDLGPEIGVDGRQLRTRRLVVQPGGIVPLHSHKDRPALIYTLSGSITEYSTACGAPIEHKAGDISREADGLSHYWINHGKVPPSCFRRTCSTASKLPRAGVLPSLRRHIRRPASPRAGRHPLSRSGYDHHRPPRADRPAAADFRCSSRLLIAVIGFLTLVDLFATQAILPSLARSMALPPAKIGFAANASTLGMAISGLLMGVVSGALERKKAIALSLFFLSFPTALLAFAPNLTVFAVLRVTQGLFMAAAFTLMLAHLAERCAVRTANALAAYVTGVVASNLIGRLTAAYRRKHHRGRTEFPVLRVAQPGRCGAGNRDAAQERSRADGANGPLLGALARAAC